MSEGSLGVRIALIVKNLGKPKYDQRMIDDILDLCLEDLLKGYPELSPQTLRWLKYWFGFDVNDVQFEKSGIGVKIK